MTYTTQINGVLEKINLQNNDILINKIIETIDSISGPSKSSATVEFFVNSENEVNILTAVGRLLSGIGKNKDDRLASSEVINKDDYRVFFVLNTTTGGGYIIIFNWRWCGTCC